MCKSLILVLAIFILLCQEMVFGANQGQPKAKWGDIEGDIEKKQEEIITSGSYKYKIEMAGQVDGVMTRMPISYGAYYQGWQPNRFLRLENVGDTDVINPWITVNGKRNWRTLKDIANEATEGCTTDRDKARAIWEFQRSHRFHATTWDNESDDAVKVYNIYGYTLCGNDVNAMSDLWKAAGLETRRGHPVGHSVAEAFYNGEYHLLDGDEHAIYLRRDNETIASEAEVVRDHDLVKRTHTYGIDQKDSRETDEFSASFYGYEGERKGQYGGTSIHDMFYTLRPGESIEWRWDHLGKQYTAGNEPPSGRKRKDGEGSLIVWGDRAYDNMRNGIMRYAPNLKSPVYQKGVESWENIATLEKEAAHPAIHPDKFNQPAHITWKIASPYVIVGGKIRARFSRLRPEDSLQVKISRDGKEWETIWTAQAMGSFDQEINFDNKLSLRGSPQYEYFLKVEMEQKEGRVGIHSMEFVTDVQMSLLGLPELELGENVVKYTDETSGPREVRITHSWMERAAWRRPSAPNLMIPDNNATVEGTLVRFRWEPPADPGSSAVVDYHFQLSQRQDMRWPMSPNFDKLISKTASREKAEWTVPCTGLLNPGIDYYWHVRAKNADGVWGPWSQVSSFRCYAPGLPINVQAVVSGTPDGETVVLKWDINPKGRKPVMFRVYGSDEKGFTVSDTEYTVVMGRGFCKDMDEYNSKGNIQDRNAVKTPSNFIASTEEMQLNLVGADIQLPNSNKAFYRVVAVDENGNESGPSDYAEFPRPFIYSRLPEKVKSGQPFTYMLGVIASIGDLKCKGGYNAAFWDKEYLNFTLIQAPEWLKIDSQTGEISGTPETSGLFNVMVRVTNSKGGLAERKLVIEVY